MRSKDNSPHSSVTVEQSGHMPLKTNNNTRKKNTETSLLRVVNSENKKRAHIRSAQMSMNELHRLGSVLARNEQGIIVSAELKGHQITNVALEYLISVIAIFQMMDWMFLLNYLICRSSF